MIPENKFKNISLTSVYCVFYYFIEIVPIFFQLKSQKIRLNIEFFQYMYSKV